MGKDTEPGVGGKPDHECGDVGQYGTMCRTKKAGNGKFERDHVPAKAQLKAYAANQDSYLDLSPDGKKCVGRRVASWGKAIAIPKSAHRGASVTCGGNNSKSQIAGDAASITSMNAATERDLDAIQSHLDEKAADDPPPPGTEEDKKCADAYREAAQEVRDHDIDGMVDKAIEACLEKYG